VEVNLGIYHEPATEPWVHDTRIKAAVLAAPALGYVFGPNGLTGVRIPIQLWRAEKDNTLAEPWNVEAVAHELPAAPEMHVVKGADHADFTAPCLPVEAKQAPTACMDPSGFDRAAFHRVFAHAALRFFQRALRRQ
jgi:predicted dienelactone hydrolase